MTKKAHILGNGDQVQLYRPDKGVKLTCNVPPFEVQNVYATCIVDFKMCKAISEGSVIPPGEWIMGQRPKIWCDKYPAFYMKHAFRIKEFYTTKPDYAKTHTEFSCGHMAAYYAIDKLKMDEIHLYGFDSVFDMNLKSTSDFILNSDRGHTNNFRLATNWRHIWENMFIQFDKVQFVLHHNHKDIKIKTQKNVSIKVH
jgi:hypothetical protein